MAKIITSYDGMIDEFLLDRVAEEYLAGRRLFIGTTNLDSNTFTLWDMGAIAASDRGPKPLRAFIAVNQDDVMAQAQAATERLQAGQPLSILDGVPVTVKDEVDMIPYPTTGGTRFLGKAPAQTDATIVARLREAGTAEAHALAVVQTSSSSQV